MKQSGFKTEFSSDLEPEFSSDSEIFKNLLIKVYIKFFI